MTAGDRLTQLQFAVRELNIVFDAARNVLDCNEYEVFVSIAVVLVAQRATDVIEREWREAA